MDYSTATVIRVIRVIIVCVVCITQPTAGQQWTSLCPHQCFCNVKRSDNLDRLLKTTNCSDSNLTRILADIPGDTTVLILNNNKLVKIDHQIEHLNELKEINLSWNRITQLGYYPLFENLTHLEYLNLAYNRITTLFHGSFSGLKRLDTLILSNNEIFSIEDHSFGGLNHLQTLDLSGNKLDTLKHSWFESVPHLRTLLLHGNTLSAIPDQVFQPLTVLGTLSLSNNNLRRLQLLDFQGIENLQSLFLDYCELNDLPHAVVDKFTDLRVLSLSGNKFTKIAENQFSRLPLQEVTLTNLPLLEFVDQKAFHDLPHLRILQLSDNPRLKYIDRRAFQDVPMLTKLLVHNNNLRTLPQSLAQEIPSLNEITFYHNAIQCDCNSLWIREIIDMNGTISNNLSFSQADKYVCQYPDTVRGQLLHSVSVNKLPKVCQTTAIDFFKHEITAEVGDTLRLDCRAIGVPQPQISWIPPDGAVLNQSSNSVKYQVLNSGSLVLDPVLVSHSGVYTCVGQNQIGNADMKQTKIKVLKKNIHVIPQGIGTDYITVTWNGTKISPPSSNYQILYRKHNSNEDYQRIHLTPPLKTYTINKLTPSTKYEFCITYEHYVQELQVNCIIISTRDTTFDEKGIKFYDMTTVTALTISMATIFVICISIFVVKRVKRGRMYKRTQHCSSHDVAAMSQIPLDNLYNPQCTPLISTSPKQALLS